MVENPGRLSLACVVVVCAMFTSCGGSNDAEFISACMTEGQAGASQMLDKELGISREEFCKCGAPIAKASLSSDGYKAMILEMQGKGQEARSITEKMSDSEQQASLEVLGQMLEKCALSREAGE